MEEQFRPKERVGGSSPSRGTEDSSRGRVRITGGGAVLPRFEFGHLSKFIVSVGLALLAISVAGPFVVQQSLNVLLVAESSLSDLTPAGRDAILLRQERALWVDQHLTVVSVILAIAGFFLVVWGFIGWRRRQRRIDQGEDYDVATKKAQVEALDKKEISEKLEAETKEELGVQPLSEELQTEAPVAQDLGARNELGREDGPAPSEAGSPVSRYQARRELLEATERLVAGLTSVAFSATHSVQSNVRIRDEAGFSALADVFASPRDDQVGAFVVDVKLLSRSPVLRLDRIPDAMVTSALASRGLARGLLPSGRKGRPPSQVASSVVVFATDESLTESEAERAIARTAQVNSVLRKPVATLFISLDSLQSTDPAGFKEILREALLSGTATLR